MTATLPPRASTRDCRLYRFYVEHPVTGVEVLGYVGETIRQPFTRLMEHVESQPWMDTVTRWERDPRVFAGKTAVLEAEAAAIRAEKPLYNVRENLDNPRRIPPPEAIRQRRQRDARAGAARWVHPDDRPGSRPPAKPRARRVAHRNGHVDPRLMVGCWAGAWTLIAAMVWSAAAGLDGTVWWVLATPTVACVLGWRAGPWVWRQLCRKIKKRWRKLVS